MTRTLGRLLVTAIACANPAWAGDAGRAALGDIRHPASLEITEQDVRAGVVELPNAASFETTDGYAPAIGVWEGSSAPYIDRVEVSISRTAPTGPDRRRFVISYRVHLKPAAKSGRFAWPLGLTVSAP